LKLFRLIFQNWGRRQQAPSKVSTYIPIKTASHPQYRILHQHLCQNLKSHI